MTLASQVQKAFSEVGPVGIAQKQKQNMERQTSAFFPVTLKLYMHDDI